MPTFCRHNRFIERCPICSKTLPGYASGAPTRARASRSTGAGRAGEKPARSRAARAEGLRVRREGRAEHDGYESGLLPGVRASADAGRLADEIAFSSARLLALEEDPPDLYGEVRALAREDPERATWITFLIAYLSPLQGEDPFAGVRLALSRGSGREQAGGELPDLDGIPLGPRSSHDPARGLDTLLAYRQWVERAAAAGGAGAAAGARSPGRPGLSAAGAGVGVGASSSSERVYDHGYTASLGGDTAAAPVGPAGHAGEQALAFAGDASWSPPRRFARAFERLALPGFGRTGRYDLLLTLGRLGIYELHPDSLHLGGGSGLSAGDPTTLAAKRVFAIGDPLVLERRAAALATAVAVPVEVLDLALANWASQERATVGFPAQMSDGEARGRAAEALGL